MAIASLPFYSISSGMLSVPLLAIIAKSLHAISAEDASRLISFARRSLDLLFPILIIVWDFLGDPRSRNEFC